jgi:hypothetical protein
MESQKRLSSELRIPKPERTAVWFCLRMALVRRGAFEMQSLRTLQALHFPSHGSGRGNLLPPQQAGKKNYAQSHWRGKARASKVR